jgi:hypothetical protein
VAEFNGEGSVGAIVRALLSVLSEISGQEPEALNPGYCPSIEEYTGLLKQQGFDVRDFSFPRRFRLSGREDLETWIRDFVDKFLPELSKDVQSPQVINSVEKRLPRALYRDGNGIADYRIIRVVAVNNSSR